MEGIIKDQAAPNCRVTADEPCQFIERFEGLDAVNTTWWNNGKKPWLRLGHVVASASRKLFCV
ncbi:hypothetical protein GS610_09915 [Ruegeria sp. HKCCD6228]|uniref:hypothetical protein n=1 Tax=unclassified Ruegeria TaxID=2625375 RepID=UPI001488EE12|nr:MULTISPECIES: hypothetical protein [unclassified Ruegeria]NOD97528.1 hypothetical protein [Ruegeria sp. HKCCD6228]